MSNDCSDLLNTSLIAEALAQDGTKQSRVARLFSSLRLRPRLHEVASLAFFGQPNDVAVSVKSAGSLPPSLGQANVHEVACDHMTYFTSEAGLRALADVLPQMEEAGHLG